MSMEALVEKKILFVDDNPNLLSGLKRGLYPLRSEWRMFFVQSGDEALEMMKTEPCNVVVSDFRMPGMNGSQLLNRIRETSPATIRIILTGQPDTCTYVETVNICHYFLWKPLEINHLRQILKHIESLDGILSNPQLSRLLKGLDLLPTLPRNYEKLAASIDDPDCDPETLARYVSEDAPLTLQIFKLVNSAQYSPSRKITALEEALQYIGMNTLRSLVLSNQLFSVCPQQTREEFQLDELWSHSLCCARLAEALVAEEDDKLTRNYAAIGGLLHDVGKLILAHSLPDTCRQVRQLVNGEGLAWKDAEQRIMGTDHAAIGAYLASLWGMPHPIVEAIFLHELFDSAQMTGLSQAVVAVWHANRICLGKTDCSVVELGKLMKNQRIYPQLEALGVTA